MKGGKEGKRRERVREGKRKGRKRIKK